MEAKPKSLARSCQQKRGNLSSLLSSLVILWFLVNETQSLQEMMNRKCVLDEEWSSRGVVLEKGYSRGQV